MISSLTLRNILCYTGYKQKKGIFMKKIVLSTVAVLGLSSFVLAGGDIAPVEPIAQTEE